MAKFVLILLTAVCVIAQRGQKGTPQARRGELCSPIRNSRSIATGGTIDSSNLEECRETDPRDSDTDEELLVQCKRTSAESGLEDDNRTTALCPKGYTMVDCELAQVSFGYYGADSIHLSMSESDIPLPHHAILLLAVHIHIGVPVNFTHDC